MTVETASQALTRSPSQSSQARRVPGTCSPSPLQTNFPIQEFSQGSTTNIITYPTNLAITTRIFSSPRLPSSTTMAVSIPSLALRGLEVSHCAAPLQLFFSNIHIPGLLRNRNPWSLRPSRRLPILRRRALSHKLSSLRRHLLARDLAGRIGSGFRIGIRRCGDGGAGCACYTIHIRWWCCKFPSTTCESGVLRGR